jgi:hypothetical protein
MIYDRFYKRPTSKINRDRQLREIEIVQYGRVSPEFDFISMIRYFYESRNKLFLGGFPLP